MHVGWSNIRNTLMHCLDTEEFWVQHVLHKHPDPDYHFPSYPGISSVRALAMEVRGRTEAYLSSLSESDLERVESVTFSSGTTVQITIGKAMLHVITHDTHHRGQVWALVRQLGYRPPEVDLI